MYTAVVIPPKEQVLIMTILGHIGVKPPVGWDVLFHHMTVNMGAAKDKQKLGRMFNLALTHVAIDDKVMAFKVKSSISSVNETKHITFAVNRKNGGKPVDSNKLTDWKPLLATVGCLGEFKEVK
jgi:hypothetical protein